MDNNINILKKLLFTNKSCNMILFDLIMKYNISYKEIFDIVCEKDEEYKDNYIYIKKENKKQDEVIYFINAIKRYNKKLKKGA